MAGEQNAVGRVTRDGWAGAFVKDLDFTLIRRHWKEVLGSKMLELSELFKTCMFTVISK